MSIYYYDKSIGPFKIEKFDIRTISFTYGLPQEWNDDGQYGPESYIEAHIWSDDVISEYLISGC